MTERKAQKLEIQALKQQLSHAMHTPSAARVPVNSTLHMDRTRDNYHDDDDESLLPTWGDFIGFLFPSSAPIHPVFPSKSLLV
jgi:hypothetical protein